MRVATLRHFVFDNTVPRVVAFLSFQAALAKDGTGRPRGTTRGGGREKRIGRFFAVGCRYGDGVRRGEAVAAGGRD